MDRAIGITKLDTQGAKMIECRPEAQEWRKRNSIKEDMRCSITFEKLNTWSKNIGIPYIVGYGPLLGWYRQCSCIPTSTDVDILFSYDLEIYPNYNQMQFLPQFESRIGT